MNRSAAPPSDVGGVGRASEALELLDSGVPVSAERARAGQIKAREIGDDDALAIWSILRIRALVAMGSKELSL